MKLQPRSPKLRAQLSDKLLAYSVATAATLGASSLLTPVASSAAPTLYGPLDEAYFSTPPNNFDGSLPSISLPGAWNSSYDDVSFQIGNASFHLSGSNTYWSTGSDGERTDGSFYGFAKLGFNGALNLKINGNAFTESRILYTNAGSDRTNQFGIHAHTGNFHFSTSGGGIGDFSLYLNFDGENGFTGVSMLEGGTFVSAIPEPASVAYGLGLVALGFAGIREHRRRRAAAKSPAASC